MMTKKEDKKSRWVATLGIVLVVSLFVNVVVVWFSLARAPAFRIAQGDVSKGEVAFAELNCVRCHTVAGVEQFNLERATAELIVPLGGEVQRVKTYGELITAIFIRRKVSGRKFWNSMRCLKDSRLCRITARP